MIVVGPLVPFSGARLLERLAELELERLARLRRWQAVDVRVRG